MFERLAGIAAATGLALVAVSTLPAEGSAQEPEAATTEVARQEPASWALDCGGAEAGEQSACQVSQSVTVRETGQRILMVVVQKDVTQSATHMLLALPHRIHLPSGVDVTVAGRDSHSVPFETCDERACYASVEMSSGFVDEVRGGTSMDVTFHNLAGKPVTVPLSLQGFGAIYDRLP